MAAIFLGASVPRADWAPWSIGLAGLAGGALGGVLLGAITGVVARDLRPWVDESHWSLHGRVSVVTGANSGLGREIALGLARLGSAVVLMCRRDAEGEQVRKDILTSLPRADVSVSVCDLGDFASIRRAADRLLTKRSRLTSSSTTPARRAPGLSTAAVHPGAVLTGAQARLPWYLRVLVHTAARPAFVRAEVGAIPVLRLASIPDVSEWSGRFFDRCQLAPDVPEPGIAKAFWQACEDLTGTRWPTEPYVGRTTMPASA